MRVTNIGLTNSAIIGLQRAARDVEEAQARATSGLRVERVSDDPNAASSIMSSAASLRALDQYRRNIDSATVRANAEESVLDQLSKTLERAKQLGVQEGTATASAQTRLVAKSEIDQLLAFAVQLANTRVAGEYLFGGDQSGTPPITSSVPPFTTAAPSGQRRTEISANQYLNVNHNATQVFLDTNVLSALDELSTALGANDQPGILTALTSMDAAIGNVQTIVGDVGAQSAQMEVTQANLVALDGTLKTFKSNLEDVDLEEAVTRLVSKQNAYQAALMATSRVLSLSLADYMK